MKKTLLALAALIASTAMAAEVIETITMSNGNKYEGYMCMQKANGEISILADTTVAYLPSDVIDRIEHHSQTPRKTIFPKASSEPAKQLSDIYYTVVDSVNTSVADVVEVDSTNHSTSATFKIVKTAVPRQEVIRNVEILEEGSVVKYRDTYPHEVQANMSEISVITRDLRNPKQVNGINDEIITKNSGMPYLGQIISSEPGKLTRIDCNGRIYSILPSDIAVQRRVAVDTDEPIFYQAPLIETIYLDKNEVIHDVVIIEQDYAKGTFKYIDHNNTTNIRNLKEIREIRKDRNKSYAPRMEFEYEKDSVYLNHGIISFVGAKRSKNVLKLNVANLNIPTITPENGTIVLEGSDNLTIGQLILVPVQPLNFEVKVNTDNLIYQTISVTSQNVNKNGILSRTFPVSRAGFYALINLKENKMSIFRVK
ncbi:MAG: hypothetical protein NC039_02815 [Muribaculaceae bacterium]|nr:hypothetical protein [Muribaculaceae bacterium]